MADDSLEETYTVDYHLGVDYELNQRPGILAPLVGMSQNYTDTRAQLVDRFDDVDLEEKATRHAETNYGDIDVTRRYIKKPKSFNKAILLDRDDMKSTKLDLGNPISKQLGQAVRRYHDDQWLTGFYGNGYSGVDGDTAVPFDSNNQIAINATGFTEDKLEELTEAMLAKDIDMEMEQPIVLLDPKSRTDLFNIDRYVNFDYNENRTLARNELKPWRGFRFIGCNLTSSGAYPRGSALAVPGTDQVDLPVFCPRGLARGVWTDFFGDVKQLEDKSYSWQFFAEACSAVVRTNEDYCWTIGVDHSP
jgi:hypothetical protein